MMNADEIARGTCETCRFWSKGSGVYWAGGIPDWCGEYAEPMRGDELACAGYQTKGSGTYQEQNND